MFGNSQSKTAPTISTLRAQSSIFGVVLPVFRGTQRLPAKLIDWTDFTAIKHTEKVGKGFGGGTSTSYTYTACVDLALAMSECVRIGTIWDSQGSYGSGGAIEQITIPSGDYTPVQATLFASDTGVSIITAQQVWVPAYDPSTGLPSGNGQPGVGDGYYETQNVYTPMRRVSGTPAAGQYRVTGSAETTKYTFNSADAGKSAKLQYRLTIDIASEFVFFDGSRPQSPWSYMQSRYPSRALAYAGTCHAAAINFDLGSSGALNNLQFEVVGPSVFGGSIEDASVDECIRMVTTDPDGGCGFNVAEIGDLTDVLDYTASAGIFLSPVMDSQKTAASYLQDICEAANIAPFLSEGILKFTPYGDLPIAANGHSFTPSLTPVYDLCDDDFIGDEPAVTVEREDPETLNNVFEVDILDRAIGYNSHPIKDKDSALIARFGMIPANPKRYDMICDANVGARVVNHQRLRATQIETLKVSFKLGWQYELLEPMDIVTLTVSEYGWTKVPFRLKEFSEDEKSGAIEWTAEPLIYGACSSTLYPKQSPGGTSTQVDAAPGDSATPYIFEPPALLSENDPEVWIATAGDPTTWGGCLVHVSVDGGTSYTQVGTISTPARMGVLSAALQNGADPDTTNTLAVDLTASQGMLVSSNATARDAFLTGCMVDGEIISYLTATLTDTYKYLLTSLRRGGYGSTISYHSAGANFCFLDSAIFKLPFSSALIGKTLYIKLQAFNTVSKAYQDLSECTAWAFTPTGPSYPAPPIVAISKSSTNTSGSGSSYAASDGVTVTGTGLTTATKVWLTISWTWPVNYPTPTGFEVVAFTGSDPTATANYLFPIATVGASTLSYTVAVSPTSNMSVVNAAVRAIYA